MIVVRLQRTFPLRISEWLLSAVMISLGLILLGNPDLLRGKAALSFLLAEAPQAQWGFWILATGMIRLTALAINGAWRASPHIRAACAFLSVFVWLQLTMGIGASHVPTLALAIYPWFLVVDTYNVFKASSDARIADDRANGIKS